MDKFNVTYDIVTPESAEIGDTAENGFIIEDATLAQAIDAFEPDWRYHGFPHVEASDWPVGEDVRWFTIINDADLETGHVESRSLHIPAHMSGEARLRLAKLFGLIK